MTLDPKNPPWFGNAAQITTEGLVVTSFTDKNRAIYYPHTIGDVAFLTNTFSDLAEALKLADADRIELFRLVRQWVVRDHRAGDFRLHFKV